MRTGAICHMPTDAVRSPVSDVFSPYPLVFPPAADVPPMIRALASNSRNRFTQAMDSFYANCFHQGKLIPWPENLIHIGSPPGSRYPASVPTAKWIAHLLQYDRVLAKAELLQVPNSV